MQTKHPDPISKDPAQRFTAQDWEFLTEQLEDAIVAFVSRLSKTQIIALCEQHYDQAERDYQDWLSLE